MDSSSECAPPAGRTGDGRSAADDAVDQAAAIGRELRALIAQTSRATDILTVLMEELLAEARERRRHLCEARSLPAGKPSAHHARLAEHHPQGRNPR